MELLCHAVLAVMCGVALVMALRITNKYDRPFDLDQLRDVGMAQSILAGRYPADYQYLGETNWYNPLAAFVIAAISLVSGLDAQVADVRIGPWANLAIPVAFYLLMCRLVNPFAALAGTCYLVFGAAYANSGRTSWAQATYSPWLFEPTLTLPVFFLALLVFAKALETGRMRWYIVAGCMHGIVFFGHAAPAITLGLIAALAMARDVLANWREDFLIPQTRRAVLQFAVMMTFALLVSSPFWLPIWKQYRFHMENPYHAAWIYNILQLKSIGQFASEQMTFPSAFAILGLIGLWKRDQQSPVRTIVLGWLFVSVLFLLHNYAWQMLAAYGIYAPIFVPTYHFLLYFTGVKALLFGFGLYLTAKFILAMIPKISTISTARQEMIAGLLVMVLAGGALRAFWPTYLKWYEFQAVQSFIEERNEEYDGFKSYHWIIRNTEPTDVFCCSQSIASQIIAPTGRKLISTVAEFSNPYANAKQRATDNGEILDSLLIGKSPAVASKIQQYGVKWVISTNAEAEKLQNASAAQLRNVYKDAKITIFRLQV